MGSLLYDGVLVGFDNRPPAHLQTVIASRVGWGENFFMAWRDAAEVGDRDSSVCIHPAQNPYFAYSGSRYPKINPVWVEALTVSANSSPGLASMTEEPGSASTQAPDMCVGIEVATIGSPQRRQPPTVAAIDLGAATEERSEGDAQ